MSDDLLQWAQSQPGVGEARAGELVVMSQPPSPKPPNKVRHRPNNGRKKRTDRNPPLPEPPWEMLRATGFPIPSDLENLRGVVPTNWRRGNLYRVWRQQVHAMWGYTCHLCGHGEAKTADHLVPLSVWCNQPYDARIARPAHGVEGCPTCKVKCNSSRGNRALAIEIRNYKPPIAL